MSKAVLVIDTPDKCENCPLKTFYVDAGYYVCEAGRYSGKKWGRVDLDSKPNWCPLRSMPEKITEPIDGEDVGKDYSAGTMDGWNACIDAIGGGEADGEESD